MSLAVHVFLTILLPPPLPPQTDSVQFGAFIFITIITAFIVSHTYFQAMLLVFGPVGNWGSWSYIVSCGKVKTAHGAPSSPAKANKDNGNNV